MTPDQASAKAWQDKCFKLQDELTSLRDQIAAGDTVPRVMFEDMREDRDRVVGFMKASDAEIGRIYHGLREYYGDAS